MDPTTHVIRYQLPVLPRVRVDDNDNLGQRVLFEKRCHLLVFPPCLWHSAKLQRYVEDLWMDQSSGELVEQGDLPRPNSPCTTLGALLEWSRESLMRRWVS